MTNEVWTIRKILDWTRQYFERHHIDSPRLTAEILLAHTLTVQRVKLYMDIDRPLSPAELADFRALISARVAGQPTQYLVGQKEFYGRTFTVDKRVLIPRPETELLVEAALRHVPKDRPTRVVDLCTGSGCIAISIAAERPLASVWATDISTEALAVARHNAERFELGSRLTFFTGDLFSALPANTTFDVIVSNPPYIASGAISGLQREVQCEPRLALDGGNEGLDFLRRIATEAVLWLKPGGRLAMEIGDDQGHAAKELLMRSKFHEVHVEKDLARFDRLVLGVSPLA